MTRLNDIVDYVASAYGLSYDVEYACFPKAYRIWFCDDESGYHTMHYISTNGLREKLDSSNGRLDVLYELTECAQEVKDAAKKLKGEKEMKSKQEKKIEEMLKHLQLLNDQILDARENLNELERAAIELTLDVKTLREKFEKSKKKPMVYFKDGSDANITEYHVHRSIGRITSVAFAVYDTHYEYVEKKKTILYGDNLKFSIPANPEYEFRTLDETQNRYIYINHIDHIELLEGVDHYSE